MFGIFKRRKIIYPKWFDSVPEFPSYYEYNKAFKYIFRCPPKYCEIRIDIKRDYIHIRPPDITRSESIRCLNYEVTDSPNVDTEKDYIYPGVGPRWSVDREGNRFHLFDVVKGEICNKREAFSKRIIRNYIINNKQIKREENIKKILDES